MGYALFCTQKLLDRIRPLVTDPTPVSGGILSNWYATALFWKPQLALLVHEETLLPVLVPLAPASSLAERFPAHLAAVLYALDVDASFVAVQVAAMGEVQYAKTSSRSVLGIMNQFSYLAEGYREYLETTDLLELSLKLAHVPCSPLYKRETFPDRELHRWITDKNQNHTHF
ncbi:DUF6933 domain-containing protein [Comamonas sp. 4034]|uniref:DUF6933 domain-containing protein n=1 Tax=Comamonas sp. 4034 TaxID=3156455 RepID=UPI003D25CC71